MMLESVPRRTESMMEKRLAHTVVPGGSAAGLWAAYVLLAERAPQKGRKP